MMNINLIPGEIISQQKLDVLMLVQELGQINVSIKYLECRASYIGEADVWSTADIQYIVEYVHNNYICLRQVATYECRDGIRVCDYYCAVTNGFGFTEVAPDEIRNYEYVVIPSMYIKWR